MKKLINHLIIIYLLSVINLYSNEFNNNINKYFDVYDTVRFDLDSLIIGKISKILEIRKNTFVILDEIAGQMWVVDVEDNEFQEIKLDKYLPGTELQVLNLFLDRKNGFWFSNNVFYYIHYDSLGNYVEHHSIEPYAISDHSDIDNEGNILNYRSDPEKGFILCKYNIKQKKIKKIIDLNQYYNNQIANLITHFWGGGFFIDEEGQVYIANALEYKIFKLDNQGNLLNKFRLKYSDYKEVRKDIENSKKAIFENIFKMPNYSAINKIVNFSNNIFGVESVINRFSHFEIVTLDGDYINEEKIILKEELIHGQDDLLFFAMNGEKYDRNPYIIRYKLKDCYLK